MARNEVGLQEAIARVPKLQIRVSVIAYNRYGVRD